MRFILLVLFNISVTNHLGFLVLLIAFSIMVDTYRRVIISTPVYARKPACFAVWLLSLHSSCRWYLYSCFYCHYARTLHFTLEDNFDVAILIP